MTPYLQDADFTLFQGDVREVLRDLPAASIDCVVTSPPYWGLRDYQAEGQVGLEDTPHEYVENMVEIFRGIRRVLAPHGSVYLNLGDSYFGDSPPRKRSSEAFSETWDPADTASRGGLRRSAARLGDLKPKDLVGVPWMTAFALRTDGWYLRSDIIWHKPNPMPESIRDRPTKSHEYVFMLSKGPRYYFDQEAVREPAEWNRWGDQTNSKYEGTQSSAGWIKPRSKFELEMRRRQSYPSGGTTGNRGAEHVPYAGGGMPSSSPTGRNIRSVWTINTQPYADAHFATFPEELPRKAILAGCPEEVCRVCGKARERIIERIGGPQGDHTKAGRTDGADQAVRATGRSSRAAGAALSERYREHGYAEMRTTSFTDCGHGSWRRGVVLDPFIGSGTVALVARKLGRHSVGIELNPSYCALIADRLKQLSLFA